MFNITDNFQPLTDEQLTEVTGGGTITSVLSPVPGGSAVSSTTDSLINGVTGTVSTVGTTVTTVVPVLTTGLTNVGNGLS